MVAVRRDQLAEVFKDHDMLRKMENLLSDKVVFVNITVNGTLLTPNMKSGVDQTAAGAEEGEPWADTNDDNSIKLGV